MIQTANRQVTIQSLKGKLLAAYEYLVEHNDQENAGKVKQLAGKVSKWGIYHCFLRTFFCGKINDD